MWALLDDTATQITLIASVLTMTAVAVLIYFIQHRMRKDAHVHEGDHTFDGIAEGLNPTPFGLHLIMVATIGFCFWYVMMGFPIWNWTQAEQYYQEVSAYKAKFDDQWANADESTMLAMGESLFNANCVACHGYNGEGQNGLAAKLGDPTAGQPIYMATCMACHGMDGKGMGPAGNIPNFAKDLTAYGTPADVVRTLKHGKSGYIGLMPSFAEKGILSDLQYQALAVYVSKELN